jgi:hypothetical protein
MDVSCPSLPPKILVRNETDAELRPNAQTTVYMAARGCHLSISRLFVLLVIIESFFLAVRDTMIARAFLYKVSIAIVSRTFYCKVDANVSRFILITSSGSELPSWKEFIVLAAHPVART